MRMADHLSWHGLLHREEIGERERHTVSGAGIKNGKRHENLLPCPKDLMRLVMAPRTDASSSTVAAIGFFGTYPRELILRLAPGEGLKPLHLWKIRMHLG
jgi:hypothetical protein